MKPRDWAVWVTVASREHSHPQKTEASCPVKTEPEVRTWDDVPKLLYNLVFGAFLLTQEPYLSLSRGSGRQLHAQFPSSYTETWVDATVG